MYVQESSQPNLLIDACVPDGQSAALPHEAPLAASEVDQPEQNKSTMDQIPRKVRMNISIIMPQLSSCLLTYTYTHTHTRTHDEYYNPRPLTGRGQ